MTYHKKEHVKTVTDDIPSAAALREYLRKNKLSGSQAAQLVGINRAKFRFYMTDEAFKTHKKIPFSVWYTLTDRVHKKQHLDAKPPKRRTPNPRPQPQINKLLDLPYFNDGDDHE